MGGKQRSHRALGSNNIGNWLPEIDLWCFARNPRIHQLLPIGKIAKALQPEGDQELFSRDEGIGRAAPRRAWSSPNQPTRMKPSDQVAADFLAEDVLERRRG